MAQANIAPAPPWASSTAVASPELNKSEPSRELEGLLRRAAKAAANQNINSDAFMQATWNAYLEANPGLREELADKELVSQLRRLRKQGRIGCA